MIIEQLSREHRNLEKLLDVLEHELDVFDRGERPDYEVIRAIISYFEVYPEVYHHTQEDLVFAKLKMRDLAAATKVGDLAGEHKKGAERLRQVAKTGRRCSRGSRDASANCGYDHSRFHLVRASSHLDGGSLFLSGGPQGVRASGLDGHRFVVD
jgi:hemerythrin-like domain-containing protein